MKRLESSSPRHPLRLSALTVNQISTAMGGLGIVLILLAASFIAWRERATVLREATDHARGTAFFLADHAARLFEVSDLALRATTSAIGALDWESIGQSKSLWETMSATNAALPYIDNLWLNDASGQLRLTSFAFPTPPSNAADRDIFRAVKASAGDLVIGDPIRGRVTETMTFLVARRLEWADGSFRGMISATADVDYFWKYWKQIDLQNEEHLALVRGGTGNILLRYPNAVRISQGLQDTALLSEIADHPLSGRYTPAAGQSGFYHRVGSLPLYMTVAYPESALRGMWLAWLWRFLPFPAMALAAMVGIMLLNWRQSVSEARSNREIERGREELRLANQQLEQRVAERTADLQESNAEIQRFTYIISHDLRAPLVNIMGFTSELQNLRGAFFPERASAAEDTLVPSGRMDANAPLAYPLQLRQDFDEAIGFIQSSIDKMDRLIRAILLLSRDGQRRFEIEPIDMQIVMKSIVDGFAHRIQTAGATITIGPLPVLISDQIAIEQIFSNLIDNALKYLRPEVPGRIDVTATITASKAIFSIADNGRGIEPKDRSRVFDLFRRAGVQDQPGEGIGLAHVRALVRRLGGSVALDGRLGQGSVFTVVLPLTIDETIR